jgi:predicted metal-binding protein
VVTESHLEELKKSALETGADKAVIIPVSDILLDPRVRLKCMIPKCYMSGSCNHCPPHGNSIQEVKEILSRFQQGIFFQVPVKSSIIAAESLYKAVESGVMDKDGNAFNLGGHYILVFTIVKLLQKRARALGYKITHGFAAGNCRDPFCHLQPHCQALMTGKGCRHPELSSFSMEASGMDVFTMAARAGWNHYPIGGSCTPEKIPSGNLMGLVLVA